MICLFVYRSSGCSSTSHSPYFSWPECKPIGTEVSEYYLRSPISSERSLDGECHKLRQCARACVCVSVCVLILCWGYCSLSKDVLVVLSSCLGSTNRTKIVSSSERTTELVYVDCLMRHLKTIIHIGNKVEAGDRLGG